MDEQQTWVDHFLSLEGNDLFVEIEPDFLCDKFQLTGISVAPARLNDILARVTGGAPDSDSELEDESMEVSDEAIARRFYGLVHARYLLDPRGQHKLLSRYLNGEYGRCPRALCRAQPVLPIGLHTQPGHSFLKLYCPKCEDIYHPTDPKHASLDGAFFGPSAPGMLFQSYPKHIPRRTSEQFTLKLFGFKIHEHAKLTRWQQRQREDMERRLRQAEV